MTEKTDHKQNELDKQLLRAASNGDLNAVSAALENGANVNARAEYGNTALNKAAGAGHIEVVKRLLEAGADIENVGGADMTPLMNAAVAGQVKVAQYLVEKGACVTHDLLSTIQLKLNIFKENAEAGMVMPGIVEGWTWFLKFLQLAQIRQVKPQAERHSAADRQLLQAASKGDPEELKQALQAGANVNVSDDQDISALRWAAQSGQTEVVRLLLDAGANVNQQSRSGWTALMQAVLAEAVGVVSLLIERGADVNAKTFADASALYFAYDLIQFSLGQETPRQIIKLLESAGAKYNAPA